MPLSHHNVSILANRTSTIGPDQCFWPVTCISVLLSSDRFLHFFFVGRCCIGVSRQKYDRIAYIVYVPIASYWYICTNSRVLYFSLVILNFYYADSPPKANLPYRTYWHHVTENAHIMSKGPIRTRGTMCGANESRDQKTSIYCLLINLTLC